jgi:hypothetical protein
MARPSKFFDIQARSAGKGLVRCLDCNEVVALSASWCPRCGSKAYFGVHKQRHAREATNDSVLIGTTVATLLFGIVHGIAVRSGTLSAIFNASWQGALGLLVGVPIGFAINIIRSFGRRGGLRSVPPIAGQN